MNCSGFRRRTARKVHVLAVVGVLGTLVACGDWAPDFSPGPGTLPTLGGKVSNAGTGATIRGAQVRAGGKSATTDQNGSYVIPELPQGALTITVSHPDYVDGVREVVIPVTYFFTADFQLQSK